MCAMATPPPIEFVLDGRPVAVPSGQRSLLEVLRDQLGVKSAKDGCSPQGQCGCCTVLVDGQPRVACVTPASRVAGRQVTTLDGLPSTQQAAWSEALCATGGSQCGFCTPGIVVRLVGLSAAKGPLDAAGIDQALLAHLCRCTGWQTIREAAALVAAEQRPAPGRDLAAAERRAAIEGGTHQRVHPDVALGRGGFADDTAPLDALVAVRAADGSWVVGETLSEARRAAGKVQGRRSTVGLTWPLELPDGDWDRTLRTTWVEPAYLEPDASWCEPGGEPASPLGNGGAFGGKVATDVGRVARELADRHGRAVRVLWSREDVVRFGPKRPPVAAGIRADGTGVLRVVRTPGVADAVRSVAPGLVVEEVEVAGPATSVAVRAAGWAEAAVLVAAVAGAGPDTVRAPSGAVARAHLDPAGEVHVTVRCGNPLDEVVLRSYCIGAAHMALGWVRSEGLAVGPDGEPLDLTIRSFGVVRAVDTPTIRVEVEPDDGPPVNGSDAVFAAVAAAAWRQAGHPPAWPCAR
jgi:aerobic-type carbon monoxide dehydrogenase small subunit (CoxS/CutS family)